MTDHHFLLSKYSSEVLAVIEAAASQDEKMTDEGMPTAEAVASEDEMTDHSILLNKYCIFRGSRSGVYAGFLRGIVMCGPVAYYHIEESRRLQYQKYNGMTLCSVPTMGLHPESRLSPKVQTHFIQVEDFSEVMPTTEAVASQIRSLPNGEIDGRPNAPLAEG